jgi:hypothetical protein
MPNLQSRFETFLTKWIGNGQGPVTKDLKTFAIETLASAILGLGPGERTDAIARRRRDPREGPRGAADQLSRDNLRKGAGGVFE